MKKYVCQICGYVNLEGEVPETCPVCHAPKEQFKEIDDAIKLPENSEELTELEKKHIPQITVVKTCSLLEGCIDVHARMGEIVHPMLAEHFIGSIDFYLDEKYLSRVSLTPERLNPAAALHLKSDSGKLTVISHCNVHGSWIADSNL